MQGQGWVGVSLWVGIGCCLSPPLLLALPPPTCLPCSTGAVDDIRRATDLAQKAVAEYGLSGRVGPLSVGRVGVGGEE